MVEIRQSNSTVFFLSAVGSAPVGEVGHKFAPGDMVEVAEGELVHLQGKVIKVEGNKITMIPKHEDLKVCYLCFCFIHIKPCIILFGDTSYRVLDLQLYLLL